MKRYAFTKSDGTVVQVISGALNAAQQAQFLRDYAILFGATAIIEVEGGTSVWIGGTYTDGQFQPPPQPEVIEKTSEELLPSEVPDDPLPS
jgi:hypothetical protein